MPALPRKITAILANVVVLAVSIALALVGAEVALRVVDGYHLDRLKLEAIFSNAEEPPDATLAEARKRTFARGFDVGWYTASPPPYDRSPRFSPPADWNEAIRNYRQATGRQDYAEAELKFLYNDKWLEEACSTGKHSDVLRLFKAYPGFVYSFASPDGSTKPEYRIVPRGWDSRTTYYNNFGFRGPDIVPLKPDRTIRIGFLGASVTANGWPYTWPEHTVQFLRMWARANGLNVDFDLINAARGGINSSTIAQIMRHEVLPLRPDIVVYYEGGNDLYTGSMVRGIDGKPLAPPDPEPLRASMVPDYQPLEEYSALMARMYELIYRRGGAVAEPAKPPHRLTFDLKQTDPDLTRQDLPFNLDRQIADLLRMAGDARSIGAEFAMASFVTVVREGLRLDPDRHRHILSVLNIEYAPLTYAELRSAVDFENAVYRKLAAHQHWPFLEIDSHYPQNPNYFGDLVHFQGSGAFRLQGWIVAQLLAPYVQEAIAGGRLPKAGNTPDLKSLAWATAKPVRFELDCIRP